MDEIAVKKLAEATLNGSLPFPQIIGALIEQGVESYLVDFNRSLFTFYSADDLSISAPLAYADLPKSADQWNQQALQAAIVDSQQNGQAFRQFCERALLAGVQHYFVFIRGQRVLYLGRQGDQHLEWFPNAKP